MNGNQIILELTDAQAKLHKDFYLQRIEALRANPVVQEYEEYQRLLKAILPKGESISDTKVGLNGSYPNKNVNGKGQGYDKNWSLSKKAEYAILKKGRPITTREIISVIESEEPGIYSLSGFDFDRLQKNMSSTLKQKVDRRSLFFRYKFGETQEYYYGLLLEKDKYSLPVSQASILL